MNNLAEREFWSVVIGGSVLSMNSGFINVVTLAGVFSVTVSHVTGNITKIAISLLQKDFANLTIIFSIVLSFMFGAFIAGFMVGDNKFRLGRTYGYALLLESAALFLSFVFLKREWIFGEWCAAFGCGLQNALATSYSGAVVRTTHMTGVVTDIGNIFGQYCRKDTKAELWRLKVHIPLLFSFLFGAVFGQIMFLEMKENAMLLPCFFSGLTGCAYLTLPTMKEAQEKLKEITKMFPGHEPTIEIRRIGDPRQQDVFQSVQGRNVEDEIDTFMKEINSDPNESGRFRNRKGSSASLIQLNAPVVDAGGAVEVLYTPRQNKLE